MEQELSNKLSTTELLKLSLTDFLEEIKQDYKFSIYDKELESCQKILRFELEDYLERVSNNFENADKVYSDLISWELSMKFGGLSPYDLPILWIMKEILLEKIEDNFYYRTFKFLKRDKHFKIDSFETPFDSNGMDESTIAIHEATRKGYNRAFKDFNSLEQETNDKNENTDKPERIIDSERLKGFFNSTFKGMGNGNIDYLSTFIDELKRDRTAKAFAQIALMCYNGKQMNDRKPKTFSEWYSIFCECVMCEKKTYKPKDLSPITENIEKLFNYLM